MAADPYRYFRVEARELVDDLGRGVLELEKGAPTPDLVSRLLRLAHTLKGAARVVKQVAIAELAHQIEDHLAPLRAPEGDVRVEVEPLLACLDRISELLRVLQVAPAVATSTAAPATAAPATAPTSDDLRGRMDVVEIDALLDGLSEASVALGAMRHGVTDIERAGHLAELLVDQLGVRSSGDVQGARAAGLATELRALVGALHRDIRRETERLGRELLQVRESAERLRLIPTSAAFAPLERIARDSAAATGRAVRFTTAGGDVRVDAYVLAAVQPALVQLVRNAIAHGIETPAHRIAAGKPDAGTIHLEISRRRTRICFACIDDGRGLDLSAIEDLARARGLVTGTPTADTLIETLLRGGLSTAGSVTDLSGRGVGLDVVREAAARLSGTVHATTTAGGGARFELVVPVSMSAIEALVVEVAGVAAAIPLDAVRTTLRCGVRDIMRTPTGESVVHDGEVVPFARLSRPLVTAREGVDVFPAVLISHGGALAAVRVDRIRGTQNVVLRPLPDLAPADPTIAGLSLDERGDPQLVLDPEGVVASAAGGAVSTAKLQRAKPLPILVVDDSLTTRMLEQSILESAGYEVETADSAEAALELVRDHDYALILVDVEMPGMDGFTFVERTRADPRLREVPCILVTSRDAPEDRERGRTAGASAYMVKSEFDQNTLLGKIADLARRR